jgi:creatinine amidohydrolase/Fe(II)-dependent formamide hydrolase-like protein
MTARTPPLCVADDATFWPWRRWPEFSRWADPANTVVVVPLAGTAEWGLGHPLDAEETVLMNVLRAASLQCPATLPLLVVPPLRFVLGPAPGCAFTLEPPVAQGYLADVLGSIHVSGFRRVVLYNSSPWNEELIAAAARDNRIALGLQIFRISLSGLGLDLHPTRSTSRRKFQTLVTALLGREPDAPPADMVEPASRPWADETIYPLAGPAVPLAEARAEGEATLAAAAKQLVSLLGEIQARAPLKHGGKIITAQP